MKDKLRKAVMYSSSVTISIALDCPPEDLGFNEELVHIANEQAGFYEHTSGDPLKSEISILAPSLRDKTMAPERQGTLTLFMPAYMEFNDNWRTGKDVNGNYVRGAAYEKLKAEIAETIIKRVEEKVAPGLRSHILFYEVATPVTHNRYTGKIEGTMMGAKPAGKKCKIKLPIPTPVKELIAGRPWAERVGAAYRG